MNDFRQRAGVIVTGAIGNIGADVTRRLAADGFSVYMVDQHRAKLDAMTAEIEGRGGRAAGVVADVRSRVEIDDAVRDARQRFGRIDALVHIVGHSGSQRITAIDEITDEHWHDLIELNLTSTFVVCRAVIPMMLAQRYGRIVNFSTSGANGTRSPVSGTRLPYITAKAGVVGLTRQIALDYAAQGITANLILPGLVMGKPGTRIRLMWESNMTREQIEAVFAMFPHKRPADPEEVAAAVSFFVSPDASYVNGQVLRIDGGKN